MCGGSFSDLLGCPLSTHVKRHCGKDKVGIKSGLVFLGVLAKSTFSCRSKASYVDLHLELSFRRDRMCDALLCEFKLHGAKATSWGWGFLRTTPTTHQHVQEKKKITPGVSMTLYGWYHELYDQVLWCLFTAWAFVCLRHKQYSISLWFSLKNDAEQKKVKGGLLNSVSVNY